MLLVSYNIDTGCVFLKFSRTISFESNVKFYLIIVFMTTSIILYLNVILSLSVLYALYMRLSHILKHYVMLCYVIIAGNTMQ